MIRSGTIRPIAHAIDQLRPAKRKRRRVRRQLVPPVVNHHDATELVRAAAANELGADSITDAVQSWGGDDFAWYLRQIPGTYVRVGVHDPASDGPRLDLHAGSFDVDESAIALGVRLMVATADEFFDAGPTVR